LHQVRFILYINPFSFHCYNKMWKKIEFLFIFC
jgi:hypothetical protein